MKKSLSKKSILLIVGGVVAVIALVFLVTPYTFGLRANISNFELTDPAGTTYIEYFQSLADEFNFKINKVTGSKSEIIHLYSDDFDDLPDKQKFDFFTRLSDSEGNRITLTNKTGRSDSIYLLKIVSNGNDYDASISNSYYAETVWTYTESFLMKNGQRIYSESRKPPSNSSSTSSSTSDQKCYWCNGTGYIRYNYGSSDLEAILSGHDPYTYGICGGCGGTGKAK